ncbi:MAG: tRNA (5-methylaminomethyl-2-thiouridine)(34)-methyltransferase MnmD [Saprospiraceae bacterium]|nr:tRNA (5-methylaminomethyl-2-thiouridine)(34)-methyltransferase MnmD [Saprospiraceae bacterium]
MLKHIITSDGSSTLLNDKLQTTYHSQHGAIQESLFIYIRNGLLPLIETSETIKIFEFGFGTGLNTWLSSKLAEEYFKKIQYTSIDNFIISDQIFSKLNYTEQYYFPNSKEILHIIQKSEWDKIVSITPYFNLLKRHCNWSDYSTNEKFDLIYFDAFGPQAQSELWNLDSLNKLYNLLEANGRLVTFCAQGQFRRDLKKAGFYVEKLPGPPGKREMTRAIKN